MSTPDAQPQQNSREASETARPSSLRQLAPKPPARLLPSNARSLSLLPYRASRPPQCAVCSRRGCQLKTHKALVAAASRRGSLAPSDDGAGSSEASPVERLSLKQSSYVKSYAYFFAQVYVDHDIASLRVDPFFDLPLPIENNSSEMHMLFHKYFTVKTSQAIDIPRPPELPTDVFLSPFFQPAMTDSALCLAILAASAATVTGRTGRPAENVAVLTLFDQAMSQLRERLSSGTGQVSDTTVAAATFLWGINSLLNDPDSMQQHGNSVHALVAGRGGLSNLGLGGAVARLVVGVDSLNAIIFAQHALYPNRLDATPLEDNPPPLCGAYFSSKRAQQSIDPAINVLCLESVGVANLLERMIRHQSTTPEYFHAMSKLSSIGTGIINRYVGLRGTGTKNECACLALQLMNILLYYKPREHQMMVTTQAGRLIRALKQQEVWSYWLGDMELLVWILFILEMLPHDFEGKEWAMDLLCQALCSRYGSEKWPDEWQEAIHRVVLQFVWVDARLSPAFATMCKSVTLRVFGDDEGG